MSGIFLSYRRGDSRKDTDRISDWLIRKFGKRSIFQDVDSIPAGVDFKTHVRSVISRADVQIVVIGPQWLVIRDDAGRRRIDDPNDPVRIEIEAALAYGIPIVPLLVSGAEMPSETELPESIAKLANVNAVTVRDNPDFAIDIKKVIAAIRERRLTAARRASTSSKRFLKRHRRRVQIIAAAVVVVVVATSIAANAQALGQRLALFRTPTSRLTATPTPRPTVAPTSIPIILPISKYYYPFAITFNDIALEGGDSATTTQVRDQIKSRLSGAGYASCIAAQVNVFGGTPSLDNGADAIRAENAASAIIVQLIELGKEGFVFAQAQYHSPFLISSQFGSVRIEVSFIDTGPTCEPPHS